jgi:hypothetical protein
MLLQTIARCKKHLEIVCPFVKAASLRDVLVAGKLPPSHKRLITRAEDRAVVEGALDYDGLQEWVRAGARLRVSSRALHAKMYLFDRQSALVTSANLTDPGLTQNIELGILTDDKSVVEELGRLFDGLWEGCKADVHHEQIAGWQAQLATSLVAAGGLRVPAGLKDHGKVIRPARPSGAKHKRDSSESGTGPRYFLKMYATSDEPEEPTHNPSQDPLELGGLTFSHWAPLRPTQFRSGDVVFPCWTVRGRRKRIAARGEVARPWDPRHDVAPVELQERSPSVRRWPNVLWLGNVRILIGPLSELLDFNDVIRTIPDWQERRSRSHPRLTKEAAIETEARFQRCFDLLGGVTVPVGDRTWWEVGEFRRSL